MDLGRGRANKFERVDAAFSDLDIPVTAVFRSHHTPCNDDVFRRYRAVVRPDR
jgi:hypothetical protein